MTATDSSTRLSDLVATFRSRAEPVGTTVERVPTSEAAGAAIASATRAAGITGVVISHELAEAAPQLVASLRLTGLSVTRATGAAEALDLPLGLSLARCVVAETGSVLLAERTLEDRAVAMVTVASTVICRTADLCGTLDDIVTDLREVASRPGGGYATLVTGPSRTADIEMSLTVGVQGPKRVAVLFVDELG